MKTLLERNDCIVESEFKPMPDVKDGTIGTHFQKVRQIYYHQMKHDINGNELGYERVYVDISFVRYLINEVDKIESITKEMQREDHIW